MFTPKLPFLLFLALQLTLCLTKDAECTITTDSEGVITDDCPVQHNCIEGTCVHKDIFPLNGVEIASSILIMVVAGFANSGGIGGGAILSPILLLLFKYNASKTIMLVYVLIFGGSFGTFLNVAFQRDIKTGKPIVLYDFLVIVGPVMLIGSNLGVMLNRMIPPILTICGLVYLIITTLLKISKKAKSSYAQETEALQKPLLSQKDTKGNNPRQTELSSLNYQTNEDKPLPHNVKAILEEDQSFLPKRKLLLLGCLLTFLILTTVLRGSDKFDSVLGIEFCSFGYWIWFLFGLAGCYFFYLRGSKLVLENAELKRTYHCEESTYQVNEEYIKRLGALGVFAGVLAALLGIGGGLVLGSTLLTMGVEAQSMTATSNSFVVLTALISLFQAFLFGGISTNELIFFFLISSIGSYSVSAGLSWVVKKTRRPSILLIILSCMLSLALVVMPTFAVYKSIESPSQMLSFHSVC